MNKEEKIVLDYYLKKLPFFESFYSGIIEGVEKSVFYTKYKPENWITDEFNLKNDLANYIKNLFNEADSNLITFGGVEAFVRYYDYYVLKNRNIIITELGKDDYALNSLFLDCSFNIQDLKGELCSTSRPYLDLIIEIILDPNKVINKFQISNKYNEDLVNISRYLQNKEVFNYLVKALEDSNNIEEKGQLFLSLCYQENSLNPLIIKKNLEEIPDYYYVLKVIRNLNKNDALNLIKDFQKLEKSKLYKSIFDVLICDLMEGEKGLIKMFFSTNDEDLQSEIIDYYEFYKSKKFSELLTFIIEEENIEKWIKNRAYSSLISSKYNNLVSWFGIKILDLIDNYEY